MTTAAQRARHEPEENEGQLKALLKGMLDEIEHGIRKAVENGLEAEVRAIVRRVLPTAAPAARGSTARIIADAELAVRLVNGITVLQRYERLKQPRKADGEAVP